MYIYACVGVYIKQNCIFSALCLSLSLSFGAKRTTRTVGVDASSAIKTKPANTVKISNYLKKKVQKRARNCLILILSDASCAALLTQINIKSRLINFK